MNEQSPLTGMYLEVQSGLRPMKTFAEASGRGGERQFSYHVIAYVRVLTRECPL